jgi:hypothetical protein
MKTWTLHPEEWYPVLQLNRYQEGNPNHDREAELSDEEVAELRALEAKFNEWQKRLAERFGVESDVFSSVFTLIYDWEES